VCVSEVRKGVCVERFYTYKRYLKERYGHPVYKVGVDAGFSCPNRDSAGRGGCYYCDIMGSRAAYQRPQEAEQARSGQKRTSVPEHHDSRSARETADYHDEADRFRSIQEQIERGAAFVRRRYGVSSISLYLQAFSNTFAPVDTLRQIYNFALSCSDFTEFIISTRPDCINRKNTELIAGYTQRLEDVWVELGLQSANDRTLLAVGRGHTAEAAEQAFRLLRTAGIKVAFHLIMGLPGEGPEELRRTADFISELHPDAVKIHNLHIPEGTVMYDMYSAGEITAPSVKRHLVLTGDFLSRIPGDIVIQRLVCDTPAHRLFAPKVFAQKGHFINQFHAYLEKHGLWQGKELGWKLEQVGKPLGSSEDNLQFRQKHDDAAAEKYFSAEQISENGETV